MVSMQVIREFCGQIASAFRPRRIILFGSYADGRATAHSDVDLLVVMPHRGHPIQKAVEILDRLDPKFGIDLLVRSPAEVRRRLTQQDWFMHAIVEKGKVLYEAADA